MRLENNARGIKTEDATTTLVRNSVATGNVPANGFGVFSLASGGRAAVMTIENSSSTMNGNYGLVANGPLATLRLSGVTSTDNLNYGLAIGATGGTVYSFGANRFHGNLGASGDVMPGLTLNQVSQQ